MSEIFTDSNSHEQLSENGKHESNILYLQKYIYVNIHHNQK